MTAAGDRARRLRGGGWGLTLVAAFVIAVVASLYGYYLNPHISRAYGHQLRFNKAMFGPALEQPIPFSHRLHVTDKGIDCRYCHPYGDRSLNAGIPSVMKCLGCHDHIIPGHEEIEKLRAYRDRGRNLPWVRVYYAPDHVFFPHYRHLNKGLDCVQCHGEIQTVDRLRQVTFHMGLCIDCHRKRDASLECVACHQ